MPDADREVAVIGAGAGGLAAAMILASAGLTVTVVEAAEAPGGKMRSLPSAAGPVEAGPTVLTMLDVFETLFAETGERLADRVAVERQDEIARHFWPGGGRLDLCGDPARDAAAIRAFAGRGAEADFLRFRHVAAALHRAFELPVIRAPRPSAAGAALGALAAPAAWPWLLPGRTLDGMLRRTFRDPRLVQLFGRYATYVGGSPFRSPAVLALIWHAEASGVWSPAGGMSALAGAMAAAAAGRGAGFRYGLAAREILAPRGRVEGVALSDGSVLRAGHVVFNGDPCALVAGQLGAAARSAVPPGAVARPSRSAWVWSFAARCAGPELGHHNVFFAGDPVAEHGPIDAGRMPDDPTLYVCAEDRASGRRPAGVERFEIIMNAPAAGGTAAPSAAEEYRTCLERTFATLGDRFGLTFDPLPGPEALTGPAEFARMFPGSRGALYGPSPHGTLAAFRRPAVRTSLPGLWLSGGGTHPGAGVPMAALSGMHCAHAILRALPASTSTSRPTAMPGGMSTAFPTTPAARSRS
ncbi:MAG: FAD-dependent oxidoreductase [Rhodobacteraceae bacterium]|nr:FAD-dependent oxidoreductase [Paracoccaceae bacterium]